MKLIKAIPSGLMVALALAAAPAAAEEKAPVQSVLERVEMVELVPGGAFHVSEIEAQQLVAFGCAFGPVGAFKVKLGPNESPCSEKAIDVKRKATKAGGFVYDIRRVGSMFVYTMTDQGMSRNVNFKCQFNVLSNGQVTENQCVNTANGKMMFDQVAGSILSNTLPTVLGSIASNVTAPKAGDSVINVGSQSLAGADANARSTGGGGSAPIYIDVSAIGNNAPITAASQSGAAINNPSANCGKPVCG